VSASWFVSDLSCQRVDCQRVDVSASWFVSEMSVSHRINRQAIAARPRRAQAALSWEKRHDAQFVRAVYGKDAQPGIQATPG